MLDGHCVEHAVTKIKQNSCYPPAYSLKEKEDGWELIAGPFAYSMLEITMVLGHREVHVGRDKERGGSKGVFLLYPIKGFCFLMIERYQWVI